MSPEHARVFVIEDDDNWQDLIKDILKDEGHEVVLTSTNLYDALDNIEKIKELKINVVTIDGNLDEDETEGYDGQEVLEAVRKIAPEVKTVGMGGNAIPGVDLDLGKGNCIKLGKEVTKL